jgi:hypothetical protein
MFSNGIGQKPNYTKKHFVKYKDTSEFKAIRPINSGSLRTFVLTHIEMFDLDDDNTTFIKNSDSVLLCIEGNELNGKREGKFNFYVIDSCDHKKKYKIWEQTFSNDKLNGQ